MSLQPGVTGKRFWIQGYGFTVLHEATHCSALWHLSTAQPSTKEQRKTVISVMQMTDMAAWWKRFLSLTGQSDGPGRLWAMYTKLRQEETATLNRYRKKLFHTESHFSIPLPFLHLQPL